MSIPLKNKFCNQIEIRFRSSIRDYGITAQDKLLVAVSGGLDSTVLAHLCQNAGLNFRLVHMNYGLRDAASDADERACMDLSRKMNRSFHSRQVKNEISIKTPNLQAVARNLRYNWFADLLAQYNCQWVLTGHHLDDHAETIIHQFIRGGGPDTLTGFFHSLHFVARPLMQFKRSEILQYAQLQGIKWREDESNSKELYTRNKIRHSLLPVLKEYNSGLEQALIDRAKALHDVLAFAQYSVQREIEDRIIVKNGVFSLDAGWLKTFPFKVFFLRSWLIAHGFSEGEIDAAVLLLKKSRGELRGDNKVLRLTATALQLIPAPKPVTINTRIMIPFRWSAEGLCIEVCDFDTRNNSAPWALIDKVWFEGEVILRNWKPADRFIPSGMKGSKKIGDFLTSLKVPVSERSRVLVLEKDGNILAVMGYRLSQQVSKLQDPNSAVAVFFDGATR